MAIPGLPAQPSTVCEAVLAYNDEEIWRVARYSAMQAMPILIAQGEDTSLSKQAVLLHDTIADMVRQLVDEKEEFPNEQPGIYKIEVHLVKQFGEGISDKTKNELALSIDISIPLEFENLLFPPEHYKIAKKLGRAFFQED